MSQYKCKCREMAVGYIVRPDGYSCKLCDQHFSDDFKTIKRMDDGWTVGRYPFAQRDPSVECDRVLDDMEVVKLRDIRIESA